MAKQSRVPEFLFGIAAALLLMARASSGRAGDGSAKRSMEGVFHDKTVRLVLPTAPGGGRGLYALPFANYFGKHLPGHPTIEPVFMPGAGGSVAANYLYNVAAPDGLTIISPLKSLVISQAIHDPSVKYDVSRMKWIGRITSSTQLFFVSSKVGASDFETFKTRQIVVATTGYSSPTYQLASFSNHVLGTKFKIITGYDSAAAMNMSVQTGEAQGAFTSLNDLATYHRDWIRDGRVKILLQIAIKKSVDLPDVPLLTDLATTPEDRALGVFMSSSSDFGEAYAAPPGTPADVVQALRTAFDATMADPDFIAKLRDMKVEFSPLTGGELTSLVDATIGAPPSIIRKYEAAISR